MVLQVLKVRFPPSTLSGHWAYCWLCFRPPLTPLDGPFSFSFRWLAGADLALVTLCLGCPEHIRAFVSSSSPMSVICVHLASRLISVRMQIRCYWTPILTHNQTAVLWSPGLVMWPRPLILMSFFLFESSLCSCHAGHHARLEHSEHFCAYGFHFLKYGFPLSLWPLLLMCMVWRWSTIGALLSVLNVLLKGTAAKEKNK